MSMRYIRLSQGKFAMVDDHNFERLSQYRWKVIKDTRVDGRNVWYAYREDSNGKLVAMHQDILEARPGKLIDHRDGDGLNNRETNLRYATHAENGANRVKQSGASSKYKGVTLIPARFVARIKVGDRQVHLGTFEFEADAAMAYDAAARKHLGEFAKLNFP